MDYEKAYKEAQKRAKIAMVRCRTLPTATVMAVDYAISYIFNEPDESEDEKIRREICALVRKRANFNDVDRMLAYLENQKEQKSAEIRDSRQIAFMIENGRRSGVIEGRKQVVDNPEEYGLCKPAEWSKEDESRLDHAITTLAENVKRGSAREDFEFLASLPRRFNLQPKTEWNEEDEKYDQ